MINPFTETQLRHAHRQSSQKIKASHEHSTSKNASINTYQFLLFLPGNHYIHLDWESHPLFYCIFEKRETSIYITHTDEISIQQGSCCKHIKY